MKKRHLNWVGLWVLLFLVSSIPLQAQTRYTIASTVALKVSGTSTLHDWDMTSTKASGQAMLELDNGTLKGIQSLSVEMMAESLKSGKSQMDGNAYKALKTKQYPKISYTLKSIKRGQGEVWSATGEMTIAGVTKPLTMSVTAKKQGEVYEFSGSIPVKLTDYNMDPPTAVLGTIKTGNDVKITFSTKFNPSK